MRLYCGTIVVWLLIVLLIVVWATMATAGVLSARAIGLPERPVLIAVSGLFFIGLWGIPAAIVYRLVWSEGDDSG